MAWLGAADRAPVAGSGGHQNNANQKENNKCPLGA
jgi:hypothetical protein